MAESSAPKKAKKDNRSEYAEYQAKLVGHLNCLYGIEWSVKRMVAWMKMHKERKVGGIVRSGPQGPIGAATKSDLAEEDWLLWSNLWIEKREGVVEMDLTSLDTFLCRKKTLEDKYAHLDPEGLQRQYERDCVKFVETNYAIFERVNLGGQLPNAPHLTEKPDYKDEQLWENMRAVSEDILKLQPASDPHGFLRMTGGRLTKQAILERFHRENQETWVYNCAGTKRYKIRHGLFMYMPIFSHFAFEGPAGVGWMWPTVLACHRMDEGGPLPEGKMDSFYAKSYKEQITHVLDNGVKMTVRVRATWWTQYEEYTRLFPRYPAAVGKFYFDQMVCRDDAGNPIVEEGDFTGQRCCAHGQMCGGPIENPNPYFFYHVNFTNRENVYPQGFGQYPMPTNAHPWDSHYDTVISMKRDLDVLLREKPDLIVFKRLYMANCRYLMQELCLVDENWRYVTALKIWRDLQRAFVDWIWVGEQTRMGTDELNERYRKEMADTITHIIHDDGRAKIYGHYMKPIDWKVTFNLEAHWVYKLTKMGFQDTLKWLFPNECPHPVRDVQSIIDVAHGKYDTKEWQLRHRRIEDEWIREPRDYDVYVGDYPFSSNKKILSDQPPPEPPHGAEGETHGSSEG
jgi:hypothetical protein